MSSLALYIAVCKQRPEGGARHWMLIAATSGSNNCTWYHVAGGPTQNTDYTLQIQSKRVNSRGIESHYQVADIQPKDINKLKSSAQKVTPKFCQRWVVEVLGDLERKSLVPVGTSQTWSQRMESDPYSTDGAQAGSFSAASTSIQVASYTPIYHSAGSSTA
ncbi:hypothetical protein GGR53DRAFT_464030 [Hypoxylon sp. FL1150]|nr:hypothetical protein GGR53DRAFT_464030 [Hypoxylon sp. FL1150]